MAAKHFTLSLIVVMVSIGSSAAQRADTPLPECAYIALGCNPLTDDSGNPISVGSAPGIGFSATFQFDGGQQGWDPTGVPDTPDPASSSPWAGMGADNANWGYNAGSGSHGGSLTGDTTIPGAMMPNGDRAAGSLAQGIFNGPGMSRLWNSANSWGEATFIGTGAVLALPATVTAGWSVTVNLSARAVGIYAGLSGGTGVVLGQFDEYTNYIQAAKSIGANALDVGKGTYNFFLTQGEFWTVNQTFLQTSILRGQQFFMSSPVLGASGNYLLELEYLSGQGIGPSQWQMVPLPY